MAQCYQCRHPLRPVRLACERCGIEISGRFETPRLARLSPAHQALAEQLLLAGGNLKEVARTEEVSYPTLRKRVDDLIESLHELRDLDRRQTDNFLTAVEKGSLAPEEAARRLGEMTGGT